jgi:tetratricopeptide (TPR) repeat protein
MVDPMSHGTPPEVPAPAGMLVDFFISRRGASAAVAKEVADVLVDANYTVRVQDYDIPHGGNFVAAMHEALKQCRHFVALLEQDYETSTFTAAEWTSFYAVAQQSGGERRFVVLRVDDCKLEGLFAGIVIGDLVGIHDPEERKRRILAAAEGRPIAAKPRPKIFENVPARILNFAGRDAQLAMLHDMLINSEPAASTVVAVHNLGGTGKTSFAVEYAYRHAGAYSGVWWARAESRTLLIASLAELAARLDPKLAEEADQDKGARGALARLSRGAVPFLLVYDNVDSPRTIVDLVPSAAARVLITTRWADWTGRAFELKLDSFDREAATELLQRRAGRNDGRGAAELADALGFLPLALDHAGAYCKLTGSSFDDYRRKIDTRIARAPTGATYSASVAATFGLAIEQIVARQPKAETMLAILSFLAPTRIPFGLLRSIVADDDERADALMALAETSLVEYGGDETAPVVAIHRLVQAAMRARLNERHGNAVEQATNLLADAFPEGAYDEPQVWPRCAQLLAHVLALFEHCGRDNAAPNAGGRLFHAVASYLHARGSFAAAEPLYRAAVQITERIHKRDHPRYLNALGSLASLLQDTGRTDEAERLYRDVIEIEEGTLGREHPDLAVSLNNLGTLLQDTGRWAEAEPLFRQALQIKQSTLGPEHPGVATSLTNLGNTLRRLNRTVEAELFCRDALRILEKAHGRQHANVAATLLNLAVILSEMGRGAEAEPILRDSIAIWSSTLGTDHPTTARAECHLAMLLLATTRPEDALPHAQLALRVHEATFPDQHPWTRDSALTCADALNALGRHADAAALLQRYGSVEAT